MSITSPQFDQPTPCAGKWELFDSRNLADHIEAATMCRTCPAQLACADNLLTVQRSDKALGGSPEGTWAGQLMGGRFSDRAPSQCGTESGFKRHRRAGEVACDECRNAATDASRIRARRARQRKAA